MTIRMFIYLHPSKPNSEPQCRSEYRLDICMSSDKEEYIYKLTDVKYDREQLEFQEAQLRGNKHSVNSSTYLI